MIKSCETKYRKKPSPDRYSGCLITRLTDVFKGLGIYYSVSNQSAVPSEEAMFL